MGLIQAVAGSIGGMLADQWKDFYTVPAGLPATAALFAAVPQGTNAGRGSNTHGSSNIITNGSKIVVPEGYGLLLFQDGAITGFAAEPGGYDWQSDDINSKSIFAGDGIVSPLIKQSWERFKFGGQPGSQQAAFFVSLKELPDNRFGTQSEIYWDDGFLNTQVGAVTRGSYTLKIVDPILFVKNFVPAKYLQPGQVFDFTDMDNAAAGQLFNEVVGFARAGLQPLLRTTRPRAIASRSCSRIRSASRRACRMRWRTAYQWSSDRGLAIVKTAIVSIEYDANTRELLKTVQRADALAGSRGNSNLQASVAQGIQSAGENGGAAGLVGVGMACGMMGVGGLQQPVTPAARRRRPGRQAEEGQGDARSRPDHAGRLRRAEGQGAGPVTARRNHVRTRNTPPPLPPVTGPGSPQDVPPLPGSFPVDPATLPAADPRRAASARPGRHRHGRRRAQGRPQPLPEMRRDRHPAEARQRPAGLPVLPQRVAGRAGRGGIRVRRRARPAQGHGHRLRRARHRGRRRQPDELQVHRLRRRGDGQYRTSAMTARCHWCRHVFGVNEQVANGAVPDAVLPFHIRKDDAVARIRQFVDKRRLFALKAFKEQFTPENVIGVYLPYMIVDGNVERRRRRPGRDPDAPLHARQRRQEEDLLRRRRVPGRSGTWTSPWTTCRWNPRPNAATWTRAPTPTTSSTPSCRSTPRTR